ncbi:cytochrome P450 [Pseudoneurospora amorphoporcata]|uniref:Cytochrome P450 monooxygenase ABA1 n=1 Tax=Pseudoneurospora amorphoporcata TaxID=241081 RepID=A0AAN6NL40_9PEZI|nr:cytochrome P450 [Pseudoneurospora amorphoporcata]
MALTELLVALPLVSRGLTAPQVTAIYLVIGFLSWYIFTSITAWYRLKDFPGPPTTGFSNLWAARAIWTGKAHKFFVEAQEEYGPITRIGPNTLMVCDAATVVDMNAVRSSYTRSKDWYHAARLDPYDHNVLSETDSAIHNERKQKLYAGYNGKGEMDMEKDVDMILSEAIDLIRTKYMHSATSGPKPNLDFTRISRHIAVDAVTQAGFGKAWGDVREEKDHYDWLKTVDSMAQLLHSLAFLPELNRILFSKPSLALIGPKPTDKNGIGVFLGMVKQEVSRRFKDGEAKGEPVKSDTGRSNMLDEWVKNGVSQRTIELEVAAQLPAGTDTTSSALQGTMLYLLSTPSAYSRLKAEIATGIREGRISSPITNEEARKLPYLQAVLNEGLRMMPPVMNGFPRRVPPEGDTICGKFVPGGTDVQLNYKGLLQDKSVFGHDAHLFRPERYLEGDEEHRNRLFKTTDLAFSHGRWKCLGQKLAWLELQKVFVEFLRNFDLQIADPMNPCKLKVYSVPEMDHFMVRVTEAKLD